MTSRMDYLKQRRELLVSQAALQRAELPISTLEFQHHIRYVDMGFSLLQVMRKHPALSIASATLLMRAPRNKLLLWISRLYTSWEVYTLVRKQWRNTK